jgi:hypothetical protein
MSSNQKLKTRVFYRLGVHKLAIPNFYRETLEMFGIFTAFNTRFQSNITTMFGISDLLFRLVPDSRD